MITNIGQGRHRFQVGQGLYTASDGAKGTVPTPSQLARGADPSDVDARWFALDQATKRAWGAIATPPMSGRKLYSIVNRLRWNDFEYPTDEPPPGPYLPIGNQVSDVAAYADYEGAGFGAYVFSFGAGAPNQGLELSIYKPATGIPGAGGTGAYWRVAFAGGTGPDPQTNLPAGFGGFNRGPNLSFWSAPTPGEGDVIHLRFIIASEGHYPGQPQLFTTVVQP